MIYSRRYQQWLVPDSRQGKTANPYFPFFIWPALLKYFNFPETGPVYSFKIFIPGNGPCPAFSNSGRIGTVFHRNGLNRVDVTYHKTSALLQKAENLRPDPVFPVNMVDHTV